MTLGLDDFAERVEKAFDGDCESLSTFGIRVSLELASESQALVEAMRDGPAERSIDELVLANLSPQRRAQKRAAIRQRQDRVARARQNTPGTT